MPLIKNDLFGLFFRNMKNILKFLVFIILLTTPVTLLKADTLSNRLKGRMLLQVGSNSEVWYVNPKDGARYYMTNGDAAYNIIRNLGIGITNQDLEKIKSNRALAKKSAGKIFLQVESRGEAYYVDFDGSLYYLKDGADAYGIIRSLTAQQTQYSVVGRTNSKNLETKQGLRGLEEKNSEKLPELNYVPGEVLIKFKKQEINLTQSSDDVKFGQFIDSKNLGGKDEIKTSNIAVVKIKDSMTVEEMIAELKNDPNVEYAEPNYKRYPSSINTNDTYKNQLWGLDNTGQSVNADIPTTSTADADIDAPEAWTINEGTNTSTVVAIIDSGVAYNHPDLSNNMWNGTNCKDENGNFLGSCNHGYDYVDNDKTPLPTDSSHGTHVAGTIAAAKNNNEGIVGVAPNAKIMAIKFIGINGGTIADEIKSINFARQNGAKVINASYGSNTFSQSEYDAINSFGQAGGIFVAAAGNSSTNNDGGTHFYPSDYDLSNIISVAATDQNDILASFSNYGLTSVDVGAPGTNIYSTGFVQELFTDAILPNFTNTLFTKTSGSWKTGTWSSFGGSGNDKNIQANSSYINNDDGILTLTTPLNTTIHGGNVWLSFYLYADIAYEALCSYDYLSIQADNNDNNWVEKGFGCGYLNGQYGINLGAGTTNMRVRFVWHTDGSTLGSQVPVIDDITISNTNSYQFMDGTSIATPHVAGLASLIWGYAPLLSASQVKDKILTTGDSLASLSGKTVSGKRLNAYNALNSVDITPPAAAITYSDADGIVKAGDSLVITANFSEPIADSPTMQIAISGANTTTATNMTKTSSTQYTYTHVVGAGDGLATLSLSAGTDIASNVITATPTSGATFTVDNTAPAVPVIISVATDNKINNIEKNAIHVIGTADANSLVAVTLTNGANTKAGAQQLLNGSVDYDITIDGTAATPSALADGTINVSATAADNVNNVSGVATSAVTQDTVLPIINSVETQDLNNNGKIDAVKISFNKNILDLTASSTDFDVASYSNETFSETTNGDTANNNIIYITFTESGALDSDAIPNLSYVQGTLADSYDNLLVTSSTISTDKANPFVVKLGDNSADVILSLGDTNLVFSETLSTSSRATVQSALTNGADEALAYFWVGATLKITTTATTTFANDVVVNASDIVGNTKTGLLLVDSLTATQVAPDGSGAATINNTTPQVVVTNPTQAVTIAVSSGTTNPTINVSSFINNGVGTVSQITINANNANNVSVFIASSTTITSATSSWDGVIATPTVTTVTLPVTSGQTKTLSMAIEIGLADAKLSFNKAVKILFPGQADKRAGYVRTGITFTEITTACGENSQTWADVNLGTDGDCKINAGSDLVIWTKHFTSFATYTQITNNTGGGGGGGGGGSTTYCSAVTYSSWQACVGSQQFRAILTSTPASCTLTTSQQLEANRTCQLATLTDIIIDQATSTDVTVEQPTAIQDSSAQTAKVTAEEKELTSKIDLELIKRLAGRILLQVEQKGQAWYLDIVSLERYYLADGQSAYSALRKFGLGIKNADINKIPVGQESRFSMTDTDGDGLPDKLEEALGTNPVLADTDGDGVSDGDEVLKNNTNPLGIGKLVYSSSLVNRLKGRIVIQVESRGEAWYINPVDGKRYYLANGEAAYQIMRYLSLGITNINIRKITVGSW